MSRLEEIQKSAGAPSLGITRVRAQLPILVRQLGYACPRVVFDMVASGQEDVVEVVQCLCDILNNKSHHEQGVAQKAERVKAYRFTSTYASVKV